MFPPLISFAATDDLSDLIHFRATGSPNVEPPLVMTHTISVTIGTKDSLPGKATRPWSRIPPLEVFRAAHQITSNDRETPGRESA